MVVVFHDTQSQNANAEAQQKNYIEYGKRLEKIVANTTARLTSFKEV
jgi:hypothetical protein